jgi:hypothetical protein
MRSSRQRRYLVDVSGQAWRGHGSCSAFPDDGVGVLLATSRLVLAREIDGDSVVPALAQCRRNQVPVPRAPTASVDERERRHRGHAIRGATRDIKLSR